MDRLGDIAPITFTDGEPDVAHLPHDVVKDQDGRPYMHRYYLRHDPKNGDVRFHHILESDDARALHDHPWDFASLILTGAYLEHTAQGATLYRAPALITRPATLAHRLELADGPVWTYVITGRIRRRWGFHTPTGWVPWTAYLVGGGVSSATGGIDG